MKHALTIRDRPALALLLNDAVVALGTSKAPHKRLGLSRSHFWRYREGRSPVMRASTYYELRDRLRQLPEVAPPPRNKEESAAVTAWEWVLRNSARPPIPFNSALAQAVLRREQEHRARHPSLPARLDRAILGRSLDLSLLEYLGQIATEYRRLHDLVGPAYKEIRRSPQARRLLDRFINNAKERGVRTRQTSWRVRCVLYRVLRPLLAEPAIPYVKERGKPPVPSAWKELTEPQQRRYLRHALLAANELLRTPQEETLLALAQTPRSTGSPARTGQSRRAKPERRRKAPRKSTRA
jgi:hypothetical protein